MTRKESFTLSGNRISTIRIFSRIEELNRAAAEFIIETAQNSVALSGRFSVALSGGGTPREIYRLLGDSPFSRRIPWNDVFVFWGDERCVPREDPKNNAKMAFEAFLNKVPIPKDHVYPIPTADLPEKCAVEYEELLRDFFQDPQPGFDLILLGLGENGHTASLFPNTPVLDEQDRWVREIYLPEQKMSRITLTPVIINLATRTVFLAQGMEKAEIVQQVLTGPFQPRQLPAQLVRPKNGELFWLLDASAASALGKDEVFSNQEVRFSMPWPTDQ